MTKTKKILIGFSGIALIAVACIASYLYGFRQGIRAGGVSATLAEFMYFMDDMEDQMANANCDGVKQALYDHLAIMAKYKDTEGSIISPTTYYADKMLIHTQLSRIDKQLNNYTAAETQMNLAIEACRKREWTDCSEASLIQFSKRREEKNPITCLAN